MTMDMYGGRHSAATPQAITHFEAAVSELLGHRRQLALHLDAALAADPDHVASLALKGFGAVLLARSEQVATAQAIAAQVMASAETRALTDFERTLARALDAAARGLWRKSADILQARLAIAPREILLVKLAHGLRFLAGDGEGLLTPTATVIDAWSPHMPGYGYLLGCHAFGLEERGEYDAAERTARRALECEPQDAWGLHALSHVHFMQGRIAEGIAWIEQTRRIWSACHNFGQHLAWHGALLQVTADRADAALAIYDEEIRPYLADDFRDLANASSLLWRVRQRGGDVRSRFEELRSFAEKRAQDTTLIFASLHHLLTMVACDDARGAAEIVAAIERCAKTRNGEQSAVASSVGIDLARTIAGFGMMNVDPARLVRETAILGGSNAQRDVFVRTLAIAAAGAGDEKALETTLGARGRLLRDARFEGLARRRLSSSTPAERAVA